MLVKTMDEQHIADIGHAFGYYDYGEERGMNVWFRSQEAVATYIRGYVRCVLTDGFVHTTSERGEGYIAFAEAQFDAVTAFETVYFWPDLGNSFREVGRVLKPGGTFLICNECGGDNPKDEKWTEKIDGMTIYTDAQLKAFLEQAGFGSVQTRKNGKGWLCLTAKR